MQPALALTVPLLLLLLVLPGQPQVQTGGGEISIRWGGGSGFWTGFPHHSDLYQEAPGSERE